MILKKISIATTITLIILSVGLYATLTHSFLFPGQDGIIDEARLNIQGRLLEEISDYTIEDLYMYEGNLTASENAITKKELSEELKKLETGDMFFTNSEKYLVSEFIPGTWKHSIIYLGTREDIYNLFKDDEKTYNQIDKYYKTGDEQLIIDSTSHDVSIREFDELSNLKEESLMIGSIGFKLNVSKENKINFVKYALSKLGTHYDYDWITEDESTLYCSELTYEGLKRANIKIPITEKKFNRYMITPDDEVKYIIEEGITKGLFELKYYIEKENNALIEKTIS